MSEGIWAEVVNHAIHLVNRSPSTAIDLQIPKEIWREIFVDYSTLRIFGCPDIVWMIVRKGTNWSSSLRNIFSLDSLKESKVLDFEILRQGVPLLAEI